jgi:phage FluMu protein gp41
MTDLHRLKDLKKLIEISEKKLEVLQQKAKGKTDEVAQEKVILEAGRQLEETLEDLIMFFESI